MGRPGIPLSSERTVLHLVDLTYEASLDAARWPVLLESLARDLSSPVGALLLGYEAIGREALRLACAADASFHDAYPLSARAEPHIRLAPCRFDDSRRASPRRERAGSRSSCHSSWPWRGRSNESIE